METHRLAVSLHGSGQTSCTGAFSRCIYSDGCDLIIWTSVDRMSVNTRLFVQTVTRLFNKLEQLGLGRTGVAKKEYVDITS
jgi:hypothetical protein